MDIGGVIAIIGGLGGVTFVAAADDLQFTNQISVGTIGAVVVIVAAILFGIARAQGWSRKAWQDTATDLETRNKFLEERVSALESKPDLTTHADALTRHGEALNAVAAVVTQAVNALATHEQAAHNRALALERRAEERHLQLLEAIHGLQPTAVVGGRRRYDPPPTPASTGRQMNLPGDADARQ